jgi:hypothetical protein
LEKPAVPIHDWTRVLAGTWHDFHLSWIVAISAALNNGILPSDFYAQAEKTAGSPEADFLAPDVSSPVSADAEIEAYALKRRTLVIRHADDDRIIALIETVSPGNKSSKHALASFVEKAVESLHRGYHLLIVDLFPPGRRGPQGIHGAIWQQIGDELFELPKDEPLTLVAYSAGSTKTAYIEPTAVGRVLIDMPLFLDAETYVNVPLEKTYQAAYRGVPRRWREVLEKPA